MDKTRDEEEHSLNALVDGELDADPRREILIRIREDAALRDAACRLHHVKTLVHHAYAGARPPQRGHPRPTGRARLSAMAAAAVLLGIGFVAGLMIPVATERLAAPEAVVASAHPADAVEQEGVRINPSQTRHNKFILHISQGGTQRFSEVMDRAERLLSSYPGPGLEIEVVANSEGLGLFRKETSTQVERIRQLSEQYDNIHFIACQNTMEVLARQGVRTRLLTGTRTTQSAVDHIIERLQDGWVYVRA
jgi:intracellular sulfur oxidation DsrE/DsrF family protein